MFSFNRETEYALGFLRALSRLEGSRTLSLRKFIKENNYSLFLMQKVARILRQRKIICSELGPQGGYCLIKDPKKISVKDVVEIFEGECGVVSCLKRKKCELAKFCEQRKGLSYLDRSIRQILEKTKITDL